MSERRPPSDDNRVIVVVDSGRILPGFVDAGVQLARRLSRTLSVVFVENQALIAAASLPFSRELQMAGDRWQAFSPADVERSLHAHAQRLRRQVDAFATPVGVRWSMTVERGDYPAVALRRVGAADAVLTLASVLAPATDLDARRDVAHDLATSRLRAADVHEADWIEVACAPLARLRVLQVQKGESTDALATLLRAEAGPILWVRRGIEIGPDRPQAAR